MMNLDELHWLKANFPPAEQFRRKLTALYLKAAPHYDNRPPPTELLATLLRIIENIYAEEFPTEYTSLHQKKLIDPHRTYDLCLEIFLKGLVGFTRAFPHRVPIGRKDTPLFTVPYTPLTEDDRLASPAVHALVKPFSDTVTERSQRGLFQGRYAPYAWYSSDAPMEPSFDEREPIYGDQFERRQWHADKRDFEQTELKWWKENKKRFDTEHKSSQENTPAWSLPLINTPYYAHESKLAETIQVTFEIPEDRWFEGTWIVAPQGSGKTNILRHLLLHRLNEDATIFIIDPKGDLLSSFNRLASLKDRLVLLTPDKQYPLAINPFDAGNSLEMLEYLFSVFNTEMTALQSLLFRLILTLIEKIPNATLEDFWEILTQGWKPKYEPYVRMLHPRDQFFFEKEFNSPRYNDRKPEIQQRLRMILNNDYLGPMFTSAKSKIRMRDLLESGKVICIDNNYDKLGIEGAEFFGRLFLALIWYAGRGRKSQKPVYVFIDEASFVIGNDQQINTMITQLRSKKIALIFAHQQLSHINNPKVRTGLGDCAIKLTNSTGEAHALVHFFGNTTPEFLQSLKQGEFACHVKFKTNAAVALKVPPYTTDKPAETLANKALYPLIGDHEYHALLLTMRAKYCNGYDLHAPKGGHAFDLEWEITISPLKAEEGCEVPLDGFPVAIPPGTKHGTRIQLKGRGARRPDGTFGDAYLTVKVPPRPDQRTIGPGDSGLNEWG